MRLDELNALRDRSHRGFKALLDIEKKEIKGVIAHLRSLSPQSTMDRGYSVVQSEDGKIVFPVIFCIVPIVFPMISYCVSYDFLCRSYSVSYNFLLCFL